MALGSESWLRRRSKSKILRSFDTLPTVGIWDDAATLDKVSAVAILRPADVVCRQRARIRLPHTQLGCARRSARRAAGVS